MDKADTVQVIRVVNKGLLMAIAGIVIVTITIAGSVMVADFVAAQTKKYAATERVQPEGIPHYFTVIEDMGDGTMYVEDRLHGEDTERGTCYFSWLSTGNPQIRSFTWVPCEKAKNRLTGPGNATP